MTKLVTIIVLRPHLGPGGVMFHPGMRRRVTENEAVRYERQRLGYRAQVTQPRETKADDPVQVKGKGKSSTLVDKVREFASGRPRDDKGRFLPAES